MPVKKRLIGAVVVKEGFAVQSFGYKRWLPIGKPELIIENLNNWGADEISVLVVDRKDKGPDFDLIKRISKKGITTPIVYGGGIKNLKEAIKVIKYGAERLWLDQTIEDNFTEIMKISNEIGRQAIIGALPFKKSNNGEYFHYNYITKKLSKLTKDFLKKFSNKVFSEISLIDVDAEGGEKAFDIGIINNINEHINLPFILFGGINDNHTINKFFDKKSVSALMIGNWLNYKEHSIGIIKKNLVNKNIRIHFPVQKNKI